MRNARFFARLAELERRGEAFAVATIIRASGSVPRHEGSKMIILPDGRIEGTIGGGDMEGRVIRTALEALADGRPRLLEYAFRDPNKGDVGVCGGEMTVTVEPVLPPPTVLVVGGGHVGKAVAHLARWLGFRVVVADDRPEYATAEAVPDADEFVLSPLAGLPQKVAIGESTYVMLTTRGVPIDVAGLPAILDTGAAYIGVIGSRRRWELSMKELEAKGVPREKLERVTSPMGLELNAETPEEIAVSMMAEVLMVRRKGTGRPMSDRRGD